MLVLHLLGFENERNHKIDLKEIPKQKAGLNMQMIIDQKMQNIWKHGKEADPPSHQVACTLGLSVVQFLICRSKFKLWIFTSHPTLKQSRTTCVYLNSGARRILLFWVYDATFTFKKAKLTCL